MSDEAQGAGLPEMLLHVALHHANGGRGRIARQERVIADLERDGRDRLLPKAHAVLGFLRDVQAAAEVDLALK